MSVAHKYLPHYTYEGYCQWEGNWEVIDGIPYAMSPSPVPLHQLVNMNLGATFVNALKKGCEKCKVYMPIDWKVTEDTIVQPDLLIVCKEIQKKFLDFPPVLVVEIISPSSAFNDRNLKKEIYLSQKVKYYFFHTKKLLYRLLLLLRFKHFFKYILLIGLNIKQTSVSSVLAIIFVNKD